MLSVANVRSASGAASYFAADNYYASADADRSGQWVGSGAEALGLFGEVDAAVFDRLLKGELPDGTRVGHENQHRAGTDLTFSLPKSWSVLALVGGDKRVLGNQVHDVKPRWAKGTAHRVARLLADHIDELERKDALLGEGSASFGGRHG